MNIQKFTQKSVEPLTIVKSSPMNMEIRRSSRTPFSRPVTSGGWTDSKIIEKMEIQKEHFVDNAERHLAARVKVSGGRFM